MFCSVIPYSCSILIILIMDFIGFAITLRNENKTLALGEFWISDFPIYLTGIPSDAKICATLNPSNCFLDSMVKSLNLQFVCFFNSWILFLINSACANSDEHSTTLTFWESSFVGTIFLASLNISCSRSWFDTAITFFGFLQFLASTTSVWSGYSFLKSWKISVYAPWNRYMFWSASPTAVTFPSFTNFFTIANWA